MSDDARRAALDAVAEAMRELLITASNMRTDIMRAAKTDDRWEGVADLVLPHIAAARLPRQPGRLVRGGVYVVPGDLPVLGTRYGERFRVKGHNAALATVRAAKVEGSMPVTSSRHTRQDDGSHT